MILSVLALKQKRLNNSVGWWSEAIHIVSRSAKRWVSQRLNPSYGLSTIPRVVEDNRDLLLKAWHDHFGN